MQGTIILLRWPVALAPGEAWTADIGLESFMNVLESAVPGR
jgi:hypothetical protein